MGGSKSQSSSRTSTTNEDNRVIAEGGGVAQAKGAVFSYQEEFGDNVAAAFYDLINLARDAGQVAVDSFKDAASSAEKSLETVTKTAVTFQKQDLQGEKTIITDIFPIVAVVVIGLGAVYLFRGKK